MTSSQVRRLLGFKRLVERVTKGGCLIALICGLLWFVLMLLNMVALSNPAWGSFSWWTSQLAAFAAIGVFLVGGVAGICWGIGQLFADVLFTLFPYEGQVVVGKRISQWKALQLVHTARPAGTFVLGLEFQEAADAKYSVQPHLIESPRTWVIGPTIRYFLATKIRENQQDAA
jgi:hypothetical protein